MICKWNGCNKNCKNNINTHILDVHINNSSENKCLWDSCCIYKDFNFKTKNELVSHLKIHSNFDGVYECVCDFCSKTFNSTANLNDHLNRTKHPINEFEYKYNLINEIYYETEKRDCESFLLKDTFYSRQYKINLLRILKDEVVRDKSKDTNWNDIQ